MSIACECRCASKHVLCACVLSLVITTYLLPPTVCTATGYKCDRLVVLQYTDGWCHVRAGESDQFVVLMV